MHDSARPDTVWMRRTLDEARRALEHDDVPVGALAVLHGEVIGTGWNRREAEQDPTAHAEMIAIRQAARHIGRWRLDDVTLYCTLEPCTMCAGAMVLARLPRLVYATVDPKAGAAGSVLDILQHPQLNHQVAVTRMEGPLAEEAADLLRAFFRGLRAQGKNGR
ncbi:MAG: tRNA adenosine(34) deaminase TadA [Anaerolineae bacterium]|nr:tRNA adenosine(34) deaminase TadA [Anaerolineae bacterium]